MHICKLISRVHSIYTRYFNNKYNYLGYLFQDRYYTELIEAGAQLLSASRYIHLNPVKANMVKSYFKKEKARESYKHFVERAIRTNKLGKEEEEKMASVVNSFALSGKDSYVVKIETDTIFGQPSVSIVGLGDTAVKEARERLEAAINHANYEFPKMKIVFNLAPGDIKKSGSHFDLGMAIEGKQIIENTNILDFEDVKGQDVVIEYIVAAAAGGHNMLLVGTPGCGKSMIAKRIPTIFPTKYEDEALEVTKIHSISGLLKNRGSLITRRPFRSPHHNASMNSLIGGGNNAMPGEISLAHNGVLFLDEIAEFNKKTLDSLRQPLEDGVVTISRVKYTHSYPADFMLVAAMNPCPCGYYGSSRCRCSEYEVLNYRQKISGPILDRLDIQKYVNPVQFMDISSSAKGVTSRELKERVEKARAIQKERFRNIEHVKCNAQMNPSLIKEFCVIDHDSLKLIQQAYERFGYSARCYHKFLKTARTFADLDGEKVIRKPHVMKALMCRDLDKEQSGMVIVH
ncbi:MAG: YifB family Mg chelatase-like AAA ATPase [Bacteroidales bacterium]